MFATLTTPSPGWTSPGLTYDRALERTHTRAAGGALPQFEDRRPFASKKRRRQTTTPPRGKRGAATQPAPDMVPGMLLESDFHLNRLGMQCDCSVHDTETGTGDGKNAVRGRRQQMPGPGVAGPNWRLPSIDNRKLRPPSPQTVRLTYHPPARLPQFAWRLLAALPATR
jgi:hypothetical protein